MVVDALHGCSSTVAMRVSDGRSSRRWLRPSAAGLPSCRGAFHRPQPCAPPVVVCGFR